MRDRLLLYAIVVSVFGHLGAMCVIGRTSASRLNNASLAAPPRLIKVDLVKYPEPAPDTQPLPDPLENPAVRSPFVDLSHTPTRTPPRTHPADSRPGGATSSPPGNPGGGLNMGTPSAHGDLPGVGSGGKTPGGWVPGSGTGTGKGSGNSPGVGTADPPKNADDGPNTRPSPGPVLPPPPKKVSVKVCKVSGMLPGPHCASTQTTSFIEGKQPTGRCSRCKPPEPPPHTSTLADRKNPVLIKDAKPQVPSSVDEGLTLTVKVGYWVESDGSVSGATITKSSGNRSLDRAILSAASRWKYKPAVQNSVARRVKMSRSFTIKT